MTGDTTMQKDEGEGDEDDGDERGVDGTTRTRGEWVERERT